MRSKRLNKLRATFLFLFSFFLFTQKSIAIDWSTLATERVTQLYQASVKISGGGYDGSCENTNRKKECLGSGVVLKSDRVKNESYILTVKHVVNNERAILGSCVLYVLDLLGNPFKVKNIYLSSDNDLALVVVDGLLQPIFSLQTTKLKVFDPIFNISCSDCQENSLSFGIYTGIGYSNFVGAKYGISTTIDIDGGASGSGVFDRKGHLVGLIYAKSNVEHPPRSFIISMSYIIDFFDEIGFKL